MTHAVLVTRNSGPNTSQLSGSSKRSLTLAAFIRTLSEIFTWWTSSLQFIFMAIFGLWVINKAGGLVYQRSFAGTLTSNEYLVLAGTLHGIHAITSRLSPIPGQSSGAQVIEGETFKISVLLTLTGTKFILLTSPAEPASSIDVLLQKIYTTYAEKVMQNPFHTPEMPIRSEAFDVSLGALIS